MIALLLMVAGIEDEALIATARARLSAERPCVIDPDSTDITVCGLRQADRFRVPIVTHDPGDPRHEGVMAERRRLLAPTNPIREMSPFLVGGGLAGVTVSTAGGTNVSGYRKPAP